MSNARAMRFFLPVLTIAATVALASFMIVMGHVSWWLAPVMIAWNIGPLVVAGVVAAGAHGRPARAWFAAVFALLYIGLACNGYYDLFFRERSGMAGFGYLAMPVLGWAGLLIAKLVETCASPWTHVARR